MIRLPNIVNKNGVFMNSCMHARCVLVRTWATTTPNMGYYYPEHGLIPNMG